MTQPTSDLSIHWATSKRFNSGGLVMGYSHANACFEESLRSEASFSEDAELAVHLATPFAFKPIPGKRNILFTMFESDELPDIFTECFNKADAIITCSRFCQKVFRNYTEKPVHYCPLGVFTDIFKYKKRDWRPIPGNPFRWLVVGAPNSRKFSILDELAPGLVRKLGRNVEIYFKTTGVDIESHVKDYEFIFEGFEYEDGIARSGSYILDNRMLSNEEMAELYHSSHGYYSLHMGEGFGLGTLEALATGLPVLVTDWSGTQDFCSEDNSFPVKTYSGYAEATLTQEVSYWLPFQGPVLENAIERTVEVMTGYPRALKKAKIGASEARKYSWDRAAKTLISIIKSLDSPPLNK